MTDYIVSNNTVEIIGYEELDISDNKLCEGEGTVVVVVNDNCDLHQYYKGILNILISKNRLLLITVGELTPTCRALCSLMCSYRCYDMYNVDSMSLIDEYYIDSIKDRNPSYEEVETFVGGEITGYADINTILLGIDSLVREGNLEGLKIFLEQHISSIENLTEVIDYMKYMVDNSNRGELQDKISELKELLESTEQKVQEIQRDYETAKLDKDRLAGELETTNLELSNAKKEADELKTQAQTSGSTIIKSYKSMNTALIKCKTDAVIYFKEISQVPYINSLVISLMNMLKMMQKRAKLIIYDDRSGLSSVYKPLNIVGSTEYMTNRDMFISKVEKFVVVEPNPTILTDILTYSSSPYNVVIIYDRMRQIEDIITGNNVTKFFVINSSKDFAEVQNILSITDKSYVITRSDSHLGKEVIDIPKINDYSSSTDTAKMSKYMQAVTQISKQSLISTILTKSRVQMGKRTK